MDLEDLLTPPQVWQRHDDLAVEAARTQQRRIEHVGAVRRSDDDDALVALEAVHFDEQLVQGLLTLVMTTTEARATMATDGIDLVDEDDAGRVLLRLIEHVPDAGRADTDEHLDEVGARDREERNLRLARDGLRQQRLTRTGLAHHQNAARNLAAEALELGRIAQEVDEFGDLLLRFFNARDVGKRHFDLILALQARTRFAEGHGTSTTAAALHLAHEEDPEADEQQEREPGDEDVDDHRPLLGRSHVDLDILRQQIVDQLIITWREGHEATAVAPDARDRSITRGFLLDFDALDLLGVDEIDELRVFDGAAVSDRLIEALEHGHQDDRDNDPENQILCHVVQESPLFERARGRACLPSHVR